MDAFVKFHQSPDPERRFVPGVPTARTAVPTICCSLFSLLTKRKVQSLRGSWRDLWQHQCHERGHFRNRGNPYSTADCHGWNIPGPYLLVKTRVTIWSHTEWQWSSPRIFLLSYDLCAAALLQTTPQRRKGSRVLESWWSQCNSDDGNNQLDNRKVPPPSLPCSGTFDAAVVASSERSDICIWSAVNQRSRGKLPHCANTTQVVTQIPVGAIMFVSGWLDVVSLIREMFLCQGSNMTYYKRLTKVLLTVIPSWQKNL